MTILLQGQRFPARSEPGFPAMLPAGECDRLAAYCRLPRHLITSIQVVEAGTSESILTYNNISLIPRIGETFLVRKDNIPDHSYSVQDVVWEFDWNSGGSVLKDVVVKVVAANSIEGGGA
jgi:hypothetical protein